MPQDESSTPENHESHHKTSEYHYITNIIKDKCCNDTYTECTDDNHGISIGDKSITTLNNHQCKDCCRLNSLNYYIKTKINSSRDEECGCHYDHPCSLSSSVSLASEFNHNRESDTCGVYGEIISSKLCSHDQQQAVLDYLHHKSVCKATYNNITDESSDDLCNEYDLSSIHSDANTNNEHQLKHGNQIMSWPSSLDTYADDDLFEQRYKIENCIQLNSCHVQQPKQHYRMANKDKNVQSDKPLLMEPSTNEMLKTKNTVKSFCSLSSKADKLSASRSGSNDDRRKKWCSCLAGNMSQASTGYNYSYRVDDDDESKQHLREGSISTNSCNKCNSCVDHSCNSRKKKRSHHKKFLSHMNFLLSSSLAPSQSSTSDKDDNAISSDKTKTKKSQTSWSNLFKRNKISKSKESIGGSFVETENPQFDDSPSVYSDDFSNDLERRACTPSSISISLVTNLESDSSEISPNNARQSLPSKINTRSFHQNADYLVAQRLSVRSSCGHRTPDLEVQNSRAQSLPASPKTNRKLIGGKRFTRSPRLSKSPIHFQSPPTMASKIEDGLRVCSSEHFEKHIGNLKEDSKEAQKHMFRDWINFCCPFLITRDVVEELRDGVKLIGLLANLTKDKNLLSHYEKLKLRNKKTHQDLMNGQWNFNPGSRLKQLADISMAIKFLEEQNMKLVNLNPMDILDGKADVILALCWNIILHFQMGLNFDETNKHQHTERSSNTSPVITIEGPDTLYAKKYHDFSSVINEIHNDTLITSFDEQDQTASSIIEQSVAESLDVEFAEDIDLTGDVQLNEEVDQDNLIGKVIESSLEVYQLKHDDLNHPNDPHTDADRICETKIYTTEQQSVPVIVENLIAKKQRYKSPRRRTTKQRPKKRNNERKDAVSRVKSKALATPKKVNKMTLLRSLLLNLFSTNQDSIEKNTEDKTAKIPKDKKKNSWSNVVCNKLIAAFKCSYSLNIILLVCLAGLCLMPLLYKDSCCELSEDYLKPLEVPTSDTPI